MSELDPRIVKLSVEIGGVLKTYEGLAITARGCKFANANQNECEITVSNLDQATRDYILTETSPFNKNRVPKRIILEVGRVSTGTFQLFSGNITAATPSQPPDITLSLKALTGDYDKGELIAANQGAQAKLSQIAKQVASDLGLSLNFQAKDKSISNYSFTGAKLNQVVKLGEAGAVDAFVDDMTLVIKDRNVALTGRVRKLDLSNGMIGIPEITEKGIKVKFLVDNQTTLGGALEITSEIYPGASGTYIIYKLGFEISSRDVPFYYIAEAQRRGDNGI